MTLDTIDKKLLAILQDDCKKTNKELSLLLNLSVTATYERIRKLERVGVIDKYVALLTKEKINRNLTIFCHIKLAEHTKEYINKFETRIAALQEVTECFHVSGDYDYILKIHVSTMEAYREFLITELTTINHIISTHSIFTMGTVKYTTAVTI